jgi:ribosome biogenesis GTPase
LSGSCIEARVVAAFGRQSFVRLPDGGDRVAVSRGRRADVNVGDRVTLTVLDERQAVIEQVLPRRNEFKRSDDWRSKRLAANVDQLGVVIAGEPRFSDELVDRVLAAAQTEGITAAIIANKCDLADAHTAIEPRLRVYESLAYPVFRVAARTRPDEAVATLRPWLRARMTLLVGQSGMGKSTLVNALVPDAAQATREISQALSSGTHTTTFTRLFSLPAALDPDGGASLIDSPGFQTFGLAHLSDSQRMHAMREFAPLLGRCRFNNCSHRDEPGCAIRDAVQAGGLDERRYRSYLRVTAESARTPVRGR